MSLERSLVLNRFIHSLLGADRFDDLRRGLKDQEEGPGPDGRSRFFHVLAGRTGRVLDAGRLEEYDRRVMAYEAQLAKRRRAEPFASFKYFQYLALLYTEIFLDRLTSDPAALLHELNVFRRSKADFAIIPDVGADDLRRLAFFMATGSGKTLLLHVNVLQMLHYLKTGRHPEALVRRSDGRTTFDNILLITPAEGLSAQHLMELEDSGIDGRRFERGGSHDGGLFGPRVSVIEIHKLVETPSGEGVSVPIDALGTRNLVIVDEGHKGASSEARTWKSRQEALSRDGFLLEYSATFAQAIGAAPKKVQKELKSVYGKAILFDYSYRYFYGDGYGKTFRVLNLKKASAAKAHELMLGGLLIFYQQVLVHRQHWEEARPYHIEKPLWVLLGTSVSRRRPDEKDTTKAAKEERTDVGEVVAFLRRFLEDPQWAQGGIRRILSGHSGFATVDGGTDLFAKQLRYLSEGDSEALYPQICRDLFHGRGGLEVVELRQSGEIGLRVTAAAAHDLPYFGLIHIGDVADFRKYLKEKHDLEVRQDVINDSLFERISHADSPIYLLIGAKKFIEGWSSWRVSSMGLLRIGKGEGSQVIQLFGRGVRLKGKNKSLKRSHAEAGAPEWLECLETLSITGWNADYLQAFRKMLEREDLARQLAPLRVVHEQLPLWTLVPQTPEDFDSTAETWTLDASGPRAVVDLRPQLASLAPAAVGAKVGAALAGEDTAAAFGKAPYVDLIDIDRLHAELTEYKAAKGYDNVFIAREALAPVLARRCEARLLKEDARNPEQVHQAAGRALKTYLDKFVRFRERQAEGRHAEPRMLVKERQLTYEYTITVHSEGIGQTLLKEIEEALETFQQRKDILLKDAGEPLPRLHWDRHLFNPVLVEGDDEWRAHVRISPPALGPNEKQLAEDLRLFWQTHCKKPEFQHTEVCLLRNLPKIGVGLFSRSGFYPDFILWIRDAQSEAVRVVFLEPHGLHHEGVDGNDRFAAIEKLRELGQNTPFKSRKIALDGYILAPDGTDIEKIPGASGRSWDELERKYPLLRQGGSYVSRLFEVPL